MSIEQVDAVDFIGVNKSTDSVVLTVSDHLDWHDLPNHLTKLEAKLNTYLRFCESGEIYDAYPDAKSRKIIYSVAVKHRPPHDALLTIVKMRATLRAAGFDLQLYDPALDELLILDPWG